MKDWTPSIAAKIVWENDKSQKIVKSFDQYEDLVRQDEENENYHENVIIVVPNGKISVNECEGNNGTKEIIRTSIDFYEGIDTNEQNIIKEEEVCLKNKKAKKVKEREKSYQSSGGISEVENDYSESEEVNENSFSLFNIHIYTPLKSDQLAMTNSIQLEGKSPITTLEYLPDLKYIAVGDKIGRLTIVNSQKLEIIQQSSISLSKKPITSICYLNDSETLLSGDEEGFIIKHAIGTIKETLILQLNEPIIKICIGNKINNFYIMTNSAIYCCKMNKTSPKLKKAQALVKNRKCNTFYYDKDKDLLFIVSEITILIFNAKSNVLINEVSNNVSQNFTITDITSIIFIDKSNESQSLIAYLENDSKTDECTIVIYDYNKKEEYKRKGPAENSSLNINSARKLIYCYDGKTLLVLSSQKDNGKFVLYNFMDDSLENFSTNGVALNSEVYLGEGNNVLALGSDEGSLDIWSYTDK